MIHCNKNDLSIYIHYPFCLSKCPYCDFNSYAIKEFDKEKFLNAYLQELKYYYNFLQNRNIKTIYFGGGTPSLISIDFISKIMEEINNLWGIDNNIEITLEANPTTVEINKFMDFKKVGINRLSIGVQALNDEKLKFFGRIHNTAEAVKAIEVAQKVFNDRYTIDLIYARPNQKMSDWKKELDYAIKLSPYHISLYQLTIIEGTVFYKKKIKGLDDNSASVMYDKTNKILEDNGIYLYEVSNYAKKGYESKHNLVYWNSGDWVGIGAGAHGRLTTFKDKISRFAFENILKPKDWMDSVFKNGYGIMEKSLLEPQQIVEEAILMGLRLKNGLSLDSIKKYVDFNNIEEILNKEQLFKNKKYIKYDNNHIIVDTKYFNILDSIIEKICL